MLTDSWYSSQNGESHEAHTILLLVSVSDSGPWVFQGYRGVTESQCRARAALHIPNVTTLIGLRIHTAYVTLGPSAPSGIQSISNTFSCSIAK